MIDLKIKPTDEMHSDNRARYKSRPTMRALDAGDAKRQCALAGRCSLEARSPDLRRFQAVFYALAFFWLDGFAVPAPARVTQTVGRLFYNKK